MGSKRRLTEEQEANLAELSATDLEYKRKKATLEARLREQLRTELEAIGVRRDILTARARFELQTPVRRIAIDGLHTTATGTAYEVSDRGRRYLANEEDGRVSEFEWVDAESFTARPPMSEVEPILALLDLDRAALEADESLGQALFTYDKTHDFITASTAPFTTDGRRHPIVAMIAQPNSLYARRALDWARRTNTRSEAAAA